MSQQRGFTLIELIVVIVILGILAATALPKFVDFSTDARRAVLGGIEASMRGANTMIYGKAAAQGALTGTGVSVTATPTITVLATNGYAANGTELAKVMDISGGGITQPSANQFQVQTNCFITYTAAGVGGVPGYSQTLSGC